MMTEPKQPCKNCVALKVLETLVWNLERGDTFEEGLIAAMNEHVTNKPSSSHTATSGCISPGCKALIRYDPAAKERPLYCNAHMKGHEGRNMKQIPHTAKVLDRPTTLKQDYP